MCSCTIVSWGDRASVRCCCFLVLAVGCNGGGHRFAIVFVASPLLAWGAGIVLLGLQRHAAARALWHLWRRLDLCKGKERSHLGTHGNFSHTRFLACQFQKTFFEVSRARQDLISFTTIIQRISGNNTVQEGVLKLWIWKELCALHDEWAVVNLKFYEGIISVGPYRQEVFFSRVGYCVGPKPA